jgi:predicted metal-dependent phosphoesterase TrpH
MSSLRAALARGATLLLAACGCGPSGPPCHFERTSHLAKFFKGNTHTHTNRSGDATGEPADVAGWFKAHGYSFVFITDHHKNGPPADLAEIEDASFQVMEGEEYTYTSVVDGVKLHPHVNGLGTKTSVRCGEVSPPWKALQDAVDRIVAQGGIAQINHPNHKWSLTYDDISRVHGATLLEVANKHTGTNNKGDETHESVESMWDRLLTAGVRLWGVASDDNHMLPGPNGAERYEAVPGRGWVQVAASALTDDGVLAALAAGDFYFSTGVEFERIDVDGKTIGVTLRPSGDTPEIEFVGAGGRVLKTSSGARAEYALRGGEGYVRVRVQAGHDFAWTQPYFVRPD